MSTPTSNGQAKHRFTKSFKCPICGGCDDDPRSQGKRCHGYLQGTWAHCSREEHAGKAIYTAGSQTYAHKTRGQCPCGVEHAPSCKAQIDRVHVYHDSQGKVLFEVVRYRNPKKFKQRRPVGGDKYEWNLEGITPVLYHLPMLLEADPATPVWVVEGEKDVDRLTAYGLLATCNPMGAGKWRESYAEILTGRCCHVVPDNDQVGRDHAQRVAQSLRGHECTVKIVELPGLAEHGDVSDFLLNGTIERLNELARQTVDWTPLVEPKTDLRPEPFKNTDLGNGERLVARHGRKLRYCHPWTKWLVWDDKRWKLDDTAAVRRFAKHTARQILCEAAEVDDKDERKALIAWSKTSETKARIDAMMWAASAEPTIPILPNQMDLDPWLFNVDNGTLDLRTGRLKPHDPADLITKISPVPFDLEAKCPYWEGTLIKFLVKQELIDYFQRLCGYALTGMVQEQILPILWGTGANGKSTILGAILDVMGTDYAVKLPSSMLMTKKSESHPTELTLLHGKRFCAAIETEEGKRLSEVLIKELTGGDEISARRMREDFWTFKPTHKIFLATNHKPEIRGTDHAIWRRPKLIPFTVKVEGKADDKAMPAKLKREYSGILAWCVRGCLDWQKGGLREPESVTEATSEFRSQSDVLGTFLDEMTLELPGGTVRCQKLYDAYARWAETANLDRLNLTRFGNAMKERGHPSDQGRVKTYSGLVLRE